MKKSLPAISLGLGLLAAATGALAQEAAPAVAAVVEAVVEAAPAAAAAPAPTLSH